MFCKSLIYVSNIDLFIKRGQEASIFRHQRPSAGDFAGASVYIIADANRRGRFP